MKNFVVTSLESPDYILNKGIEEAIVIAFGPDMKDNPKTKVIAEKAAKIFERRQSRSVMISKQFITCSSELTDAMINAMIRNSLSDINNTDIADERAKNVLLVSNIMNGYKFAVCGPVEAKRICEQYVGIAPPAPIVKSAQPKPTVTA